MSFRQGIDIEKNKTEYHNLFPSVPNHFMVWKRKGIHSAASRYLAYERLIRKQIGYECFKNDQPDAMREVDEIVALMAEVCCSQKERSVLPERIGLRLLSGLLSEIGP
ncbi:MAG: DUF6017 domain-containing protein [Eisenbergiella sp.]